MKLKNNALQELYDTVVNGTITISPYTESSIDKAFRACDEKIQSEIDILKRSNETFLSANLDLTSNKRKLEEENEGLKEHVLENHKIIANISSERDTLAKERDDLLSRTHCTEDEVEDLKKDLADAKVRLHFLTHSRDDWKRRVEHAEDEVEELKATLEKANADRTELQNDRDFYHGLYTKLRKDYDKLSEDNKELKVRTDCLRKETEYIKKIQNGVREIGYEQGQTDLWDKLQNVNDSQPYDFDAECDGMEDVINMDLEDFLDVYKKWQEEKEKNRFDHMRDYLARFCEGRVCEACPLGSTKYKCGCGYSFKKARGCTTRNLKDGKLFVHDLSRPMESINRGVTKACEQFCKAVRDADIKLKENDPLNAWECTMEAKVEINKDLLEKVCGIKLDEEEHKLEYGDAVRLPWRDYDYMYIGPDNEEETVVRMFDPKNHAIATTHIGNVRYNGSKIIIADEEDLRKIWKDKK